MSTHRARPRAAARVFLCVLVTLGALVLGAGAARADETIKTPGDHPSYGVEIEPHLLFGWDNIYVSNGYGVGARFAIPIVENGFVPSINNSVAIGFGADLIHYDGCFFRGIGCSANSLLFPVVMQWNFYVAQKWSVFGEPGLYFYKFFFDSSICDGIRGCVEPSNTFGLRPALYLGGRYYFSEHVTLTMRVGYPTFSVGVSFM
jgi:hypothetical protein